MIQLDTLKKLFNLITGLKPKVAGVSGSVIITHRQILLITYSIQPRQN
jgi:hypothetical protein